MKILEDQSNSWKRWCKMAFTKVSQYISNTWYYLSIIFVLVNRVQDIIFVGGICTNCFYLFID